ncbi:FAD synthetase 1, chloroplastic [Glycine max]|nr:FAD synthetase 1, chloroplastic [Glycine max]
MGKIDALHIGHRELAIQASGPPFLLSFVGMAKLLCWELRNDILTSENYQFGYKAAGDALELVKLCEEYGMEAYIIKSVMDKNRFSADMISVTNSIERGQVSSTRVCKY